MHHIFLILQDLLLKVKLAIGRISAFYSYLYRTIALFTLSFFMLYSHDTKPTCFNAGVAGPAEKVQADCAVLLISADFLTGVGPTTSRHQCALLH